MPKYEVIVADDSALAQWDSWLESAAMASVFHRVRFLRAIERESRTRLLPLIVRDERGPVLLLPIFVKGHAPLGFVFSPPPGCALPELGPVLMRTEGSQSEREAVWFPAVQAADQFIQQELRPALVRVNCGRELQDIRPFTWAGYRAQPFFTYYVSLDSGAEAVFAGLKAQVRTDVRRARKYSDLQIVNGDIGHLRLLVESVRERYLAQGRSWPVSAAYFEEVFQVLEGRFVVRAAMQGDMMVGGLGLLVDGDVVRHWIGGIAPKGQFIGLNELLHWQAIEEFAGRGFRSYELMGANTEHLCRHKSRYNPRLVTQFQLERADLRGRAVGIASGSRVVRQVANWLSARGS